MINFRFYSRLMALLAFSSHACFAANQWPTTSSSVYERRSLEGGVLLYRSTQQAVYDRQERTVTTTDRSDYNGDGVVDALTSSTLAFDKHGAIFNSTDDIDYGADGTNDWHGITTRTNSSATQTRSISIVDWDADGESDYILIETRKLDRQRRPLSVIWETDDGLDGSIDSLTVNTWVYDDKAKTSVLRMQIDIENDGFVDLEFKTISMLRKDGQTDSSVREFFDIRDGSLSVTTTEFAYDKRDNPVGWESVTRFPATDGAGDYVDTLNITNVYRGRVEDERSEDCNDGKSNRRTTRFSVR